MAESSSASYIKWLILTGCFLGFFGVVWWATVEADFLRTYDEEPMLIKAPDGPVKVRAEKPGGMDIPNRDKQVFDLLAIEDEAAEELVKEKVATTDPADDQITEILAAADKEPQVVETPEPPQEIAAPVGETRPEPVKVEEQVEKEPVRLTPPDGAWGIQLASFLTQADANRAMKKYQKTYADVLGDLSPTVKRASIANMGVRYRVWFTGVNDKSTAVGLCRQLKQLNQGCLQVKVQ